VVRDRLSQVDGLDQVDAAADRTPFRFHHRVPAEKKLPALSENSREGSMKSPSKTRGVRKPKLMEILRYCGAKVTRTKRGNPKWYGRFSHVVATPDKSEFHIIIDVPKAKVIDGR